MDLWIITFINRPVGDAIASLQVTPRGVGGIIAPFPVYRVIVSLEMIVKTRNIVIPSPLDVISRLGHPHTT